MESFRARWSDGIGASGFAVLALGVILLLFGIPLLAGGLWLITLGGSWYYAPAGAGLVLTAWFLFMRSMAAVWVYALTFVATVVWAIWEAGFNGWAQVPRLVAPTIVLLLVILTIPVLRTHNRAGHAPGARASYAVLIGGIALALLGANGASYVLAQVEDPVPPPEGETPAPNQEPAEMPPPDSGPDAAQEEDVTYPMPDTGDDWPAYGGTHHATRYSPLTQITPENVDELQKVWEFRTGDMPDEGERFSNQNTPLKIGDQLLLCSAMNKVISLDASTGLERWRYDPEVSTDAIPYNATCRGLAYYASPTMDADEPCAERVLMNTLDARLIALDTVTGQLCGDFGVGGIVDLEEGIGHTVPGWYAPTSPPTVVRDVAVVHSQVRDGQRRDAPSGVVRGYNAETGELAWAWDMGRAGETDAPPEGETYTRGTPNVWTIASGDNDLGLVYLPHGVPSVDYWGGMRSEAENEYSTALVALDVETGEVAWHYQTVHYDVWDYDLGSQGTLVDFPTPDGPVPALILPTKLGMFFIFNRETGELLVEVEERPVPQGGAEPERLSPTQPFVVDFPSTLKPDLEERHMWGMTPLDQLWCRIQYRRANYEGI
jgi:quinoprotein glucose dehydrogenase